MSSYVSTIAAEKERLKAMEHPRNLRYFELLREEIYDFVEDLAVNVRLRKRNILTKAPVKSGKKDIVEYISIRFAGYDVFYLTSLFRKDVVLQKVELEKYGVNTCLVNSDDTCLETIHQIKGSIAARRKVILCYDECDYGSGLKQKMAPVFREFLDNLSVVNIYFSATPEETEASALIDRPDYESMEFTPPREYVGAKFFLENHLVHTPRPFFAMEDDDIVVSPHGLTVISESVTPKKNIVAVRIAGGKKEVKVSELKNGAVRERIQSRLKALLRDGKDWKIMVIDSKNGLEWENRATIRGYAGDSRVNYLFVFDQTCTRGTDLKGWHPYIAAWHDARSKNKSNLNTLVQALLRPCHYSTMEDPVTGKPYNGGAQKIRLYVDIDVIRYVAGEIDLAEYAALGGKPPTRTRWKRPEPKYEYDIKHFDTFDDASLYVTNPPFANLMTEPQIPPCVEDFERNAAGFHTLRKYGFETRTDGKVWGFNEALKGAAGKYGQSGKGHYYYVPCYRDLTDSSSLVWLLTRRVKEVEHNPDSPPPPPLVTKGSMY